MSSPNHDDLTHLKIPLRNILSATNNFADKNFVGRGEYDKRYKGQLLWSGELIQITARRFTEGRKDRDELFWTEVSMLSGLKHKNLVTIIGFCDEKGEKIIINKYETPRGRLDNYVSHPLLLTWVRRLEISVGIAHALSYIHYDEPRDFSVIHRNINSATVLLNDDWEPKLSGFECSMKVEVSQRYHSFHNETLQYTDGYGDPTYIETKSVNHKSDIYSFGIVLFELLCGRKSTIANNSYKCLAPLAITHYRDKKLYDIIDPNLWKQMDPRSFNIFAETAYGCLTEERSQRPNIDEVVIRLEKALRLRLERENVGSVSFISAGVEFHVIKNIERVDAKYKKTGGVTHKSHVYSFRFVLSKAMIGRSVVLPDQKLGGRLLSQVKIPHLARPFTRQVVKRFDIASSLQSIYENPELPRNAVESASSNHDKGSLTSISTHIESHVSNKTKSFLKDLSHLKLSYQDIKSATNNFAVENIIEQFKLGTIYKGRLLHFEQFIDIIVKRFVTDYIKDEYKMIWTEISMLSSLKHKNLVSLIGFCDEEHVKMIIYKKEANRSLETYLGDQTLTWMQRLKICVDVSKALSYIHYDYGHDFSVIHCNIRSSKILLDDKWEPKLCGFELSLKNTIARRHRLVLTRDIIENVYLDPKYKKTGGVTHKSDVYSFGVVLFEVLCGRSADEGLGEGLLSQVAKSHVDHMIDPHLRNQMDQEALRIFSETAYCCIKEDRADRPYIDKVVKRLEEAWELQSMYENPELPRNGVESTSSNHLTELPRNAVDGTSSNYNHLKRKNLEHLKIALNDIKLATENFSDAYCIGEGGFGKVYKADLEHFDCSNSSSIEGKNKCDLPKKRSTVAIKRISHRQGEEGFIAEIEILTRCKHENIISLFGFCDDGPDHMILVYELASKGSLADNLQSGDKRTNLTWVQRVKICLDIAHGLNYIHNNTDHGKKKIIHRDIKSDNILFGDNWETKITDFGLSKLYIADQEADTLNIDAIADFGPSKFYPVDQAANTIYTNTIAGTPLYIDPEYMELGRLSAKSDIYSFGVLLLEILTGRMAYDSVYTKVNGKGIAPFARDHYEEGTIMKIVDPMIKEETDGHVFSLSKGRNTEPLDIFLDLAFRCAEETQAQRPTIEVVINELKKALYCQIMSLSSNEFVHLYIPLEVILSATNNFADENLTREDEFAKEYSGQLSWSGELINIAARKLNKECDGGEQQFWMEISMLHNLKHKNLVSLVGFCDENGEKIIVNKHQTLGSLRNYLSDPILTWVRRLQISVGLAHALSYIHYDEPHNFSLIHRDIKSYSVLLNDNWEPKLCDFQLSMKIKSSQRHLSFNDTLCGTPGYTDPAYIKTHSVSHKSDLYSFGIVLFELLCSRKSVSDNCDNKYLAPVATFHYKEEILDDIIDLGLRKQMDPQSLNVFAETAYVCLNEEPSQRLNIDEIVTRLENALKLQLECQKTEHSIAAAEVEGTSSSHNKGSVNFVSTRVVSGKKTMSSPDLSHLKLSMQDMSSTVNGFTPENIIREYIGRIIYKGRLLHSEQFDIVAKVLQFDSVKDESKMFWQEISMISSLKHKNLVSLVGFYDEEDMKVIIYKREANESLSKHLSDPTLTWMQRLTICVGVANALSYIHYDDGRDFSVVHCNIKSSKILLDDKWEPKLSGFELSLTNTVARRHHLLLTRDIINNVYMDPKYKKTGGVTHKSDVYSFGVVLFEVLCSMSAVLRDEDELGEGLLSQLTKSQLDDMIYPHLKDQMDAESLKIFLDTAYWCIKEDRADRPYIDQVVKRLEKALKLQSIYENREHPRNEIAGASSSHSKWKNLEHLKIALDEIELATDNFAEKHRIGSGAFGMVYEAHLEHFDGENKCGFPKKESIVAIKRIKSPKGEQGFNVEIETLTSCEHKNIISLLGFCYQGSDHMILVYEHASKGSLADYLGNSDKMINLTWMRRLKICLGIAHGLNYIHNNTDHGKTRMIHCDIKSENILLGDNWEAKIADFGLSKSDPTNQSTFQTNNIVGTHMYRDPEYEKFGILNKKSDIYSFGVVLFEILTGRLAYDRFFTDKDEMGIAPIARDHYGKRTLTKIVDHKIMEETDEHVFSLSKGPDKESLDIFTEIAFKCLEMTQVKRPSIEDVITELGKALSCQMNHKDNLKISIEYIKQATQNFKDDSLIGHGDSGNVYRGVATNTDTHGHNIIAVKRLDRESGQDEAKFLTELDILSEYKHDNVIGLVGYCDEEEEKIVVYEFASRGSLDRCLSDVNLTWVMRLKICIDIAKGLEFLHTSASSQQVVIHRDISSNNILLFDDWKAKITDFGISLVCPIDQDVDYVIDDVTGTIGYCDPLYSTTRFLTKESDIFSLGAVLFDILCGKLSSEKLDDEYQFLPFLAKHHYHVGKLDELVFEGIRKQIVPQSYITFTRIAIQCLHHRRERRPTASEVIIQLKKALEIQEDHELWERKLPKDYKEIIKMSKCPEIDSTIKKEELYNTFTKGILLQQDKVLLSFDGDGKRNVLVSSTFTTMFTYVNSCAHKWHSLTESRFKTVVEMSDISNLNIETKIDTRFLSPNVVYGVYLVFKLCNSRNLTERPMYVNLKYRVGRERLHAYFATLRDKDWMMIELYQFLNQNEDVDFEFLLESFSSYICGDSAIYVEGIEFRAIDKVKSEEFRELKEVQQVLKSNFNVDQVHQLPTEEKSKIHKNHDDLFWLGELNGKKLLVLSAKEALCKSSNVDLFTSKPSAQSRFQEVIELLPQQVFYLKSTIKSQMLSPDTEYACYLLFKLSEKYQGLHNPVKVRDLLHQENKEADFFYFITPSPSNINDITRVPKQREDGWMEIQVWKFNSTHEFKGDSLSIDMKFTSPEGSMSGLIVCGLEFRPL